MLSEDARLKLAEKYKPTMVVFPEKRNLRVYDREEKVPADQQGDYRPCPVDVTLDSFQLFGSRKGKMGWLVNRIPGWPKSRRSFRAPGRLRRGRPGDFSTEREWLKSLVERGVDLEKTTLNLLGVRNDDPQQAWTRYFDVAFDGESRKAQYPVTIYARILEAGQLGASESLPNGVGPNDVALQYFFFYFFDDWFNRHEGDWEGVTLLLQEDGGNLSPGWVGYGAHNGGARRQWANVNMNFEKEDSPLVFVGAGSHGSYFEYRESGYRTIVRELRGPGFWKKAGRRLYGLAEKVKLAKRIDHIDVVPEDVEKHRVSPKCLLIPERPGQSDTDFWWRNYSGLWGEIPNQMVDFEGGDLTLFNPGPHGPWLQGPKWANPFQWVMSLPEGDPGSPAT